ncbi:hypothetical protein J5N97_002559 [Dioscorea zingiberensis]|uniref:Pentatricopeptide repeat-containing protein n=1 Tax=Dioscorea zingiberensis TaxID=325984 RepID=A0A9D5D4Z7_9LILI|nr:hypothetical protein J5N97_002559 [Dioscorea zingiberensis]
MAAERIAKLISEHPFPARPLLPLLRRILQPPLLSSSLLDALLLRLLGAHANGLKALELFRFSLRHLPPSPTSFHTTLHALARMRAFSESWELLHHARDRCPSLLTPKALVVLLSKLAKSQSFDETMRSFEDLEKIWMNAGKEFGVHEFNALLRALCSLKRMAEARAVFRKLCTRCSPNVRTMNILLLGFKDSGNVMAMDLFYHEMVMRGFEPNVASYNIRMDAYCKKGRFSDALEVLEEMKRKHCVPTLETFTTLIHGAGVVRNAVRAREMFDEMLERGLSPDIATYNALLSSFLRCRDLNSAMELMCKMEEKGIGLDDVSYYTMFCALKRFGEVEKVYKLHGKMVERNFVPKMRTVVMLMKFFCEDRRPDLGLELWEYMVDKGFCPHGHALDLLVIGLCCKGKVVEAYKCFKQLTERGRCPSERSFRVLEGFLVRRKEMEKIEELCEMMKGLQSLVPQSC